MLSKATAAAAIVGAVAGVAGAAGVTPGASVQRLASPPGIGGKTYPVGVTDDGALWVGSVYTETQLVPVAATDTRGTWAVPISPDWLSGDITDVTGDGAEAVGMPRTSDGNRAAVIPLHGGEPKLLPIEGASSLALGVSGDGRFVVGQTYLIGGPDGTEDHAFVHDRWLGRTRIVPISGVHWATLEGISADGSTVFGRAGGDVAFRYFIASTDTLVPEFLDPPQGAGEIVNARDISADGGVVVGMCGTMGGDAQAAVWRGGVCELLGVPAGFAACTGIAVSGDGSTVFGDAYGHDGSTAAVMWDAEHGWRVLADVMRAHGLDPAPLRLEHIGVVSRDGRVVLGQDFSPGVGWRVVLPAETCPADVDGDGSATVGDLLEFLGAFRAGC